MSFASGSTTHLVIVRHGQSLHNRDGGRAASDIGLTELGWRQSQAVADWLARTYRPNAVVSSPLIRALQTAEIIAARLGLAVQIHEGLEEADFSYWEEIPFRLSAPLAGWHNNWTPNPDTAPLYSSFRARLYDSLRRLLEQYDGQTVIIVSHGGTVGTLIRGLFGGHHITVFTENTGVTQLTWQADHWRLVFHNSTAHLGALTAPAPVTVPTAPPVPAEAEDQSTEALIQYYDRIARAGMPDPVLPTERDLAELLRLAQPQPDDRVLDAGAGYGSVAFAFAPHVAAVLGVDLSPAMLERVETTRAARNIPNVHFRLGAVRSLPLPDRSFEIIVSHDLLQYIRDLQSLFSRFRALLAPGGRIIVDQLIGNEDPVKRATQNAIELRRNPAIVGVPSSAEIERGLVSAGFRVDRTETYGIHRELDEWLAQAAADDTTRSAVRSMIEAGLEADSAGLTARRNREGLVTFAQTRLRLLALPEAAPA